MKIEINNRWDGELIFSIETDSWKVAIEAAIKAKADLRSADLRSAKFDDDFRLSTGETWKEYKEVVVPALLTAGGKALAEVATEEIWECHSWDNCPMATAFGCHVLEEVPILFRPRAEQFINFFDAQMIPLEAVLPK